MGRTTQQLLQLEKLCYRDWKETKITTLNSSLSKYYNINDATVFGAGYLMKTSTIALRDKRYELDQLNVNKFELQARLREISTHVS